MNDTDQYRTLAPKRLPDATMFALPGGRWIAAQYSEEFGWWEVVEFGHLWSVLHDYGLSRGEAEMLAHGVRLLKLAEVSETSIPCQHCDEPFATVDELAEHLATRHGSA